MQGTITLIFIIDFYFIILFRGFHGLVRPFALLRLGGLVEFTGLLVFFVLVISFTLNLEIFLISIKALAEIDELLKDLGSGV